MSTSYRAQVIIGFECKMSELDFAPAPAWRCAEGHIRKSGADKFCAICGNQFVKDPDPPPALIEQYAKKVGRDPHEVSDDWHHGYDDNEILLRGDSDLTILGMALATVRDHANTSFPLDPRKQAEYTNKLEKVRTDLGWEDRPIKMHLVLSWG